MDIKKNQQKQITDKSFNDKVFIDYSHIFQNKDFEGYVFKRLEKISLAVHLVSTLLTDNEPSKMRLKELSLNLISGGVSLSNTSHTHQENIKKILTILSEIYAIFEIIQISKLISEMNCEIIKEEISKLLNTIILKAGFYHSDRNSFLTKDFFDVPEFKEVNRSNVFPSSILRPSHTNTYKGQKDIKDNDVSYKKESTDGIVHNVPQDDKNKRQEIILNMLKDGAILTVKDFSKEIKGCSEKTIQRELLSMVSSGVLKKEGERRWSKYSLV